MAKTHLLMKTQKKKNVEVKITTEKQWIHKKGCERKKKWTKTFACIELKLELELDLITFGRCFEPISPQTNEAQNVAPKRIIICFNLFIHLLCSFGYTVSLYHRIGTFAITTFATPILMADLLDFGSCDGGQGASFDDLIRLLTPLVMFLFLIHIENHFLRSTAIDTSKSFVDSCNRIIHFFCFPRLCFAFHFLLVLCYLCPFFRFSCSLARSLLCFFFLSFIVFWFVFVCASKRAIGRFDFI